MYRVRTVWTGIAGTPFLTTTYFDASAYASSAAVTNMAAFWDAIPTHININLDWQVQGDVDIVDPVTGQITAIESNTPESGSGSSSLEVLSLGTCGLINLRTGVYVAGREIRGKLYVPGPTEGSSIQGTPGAAYASALQTAFDTLQSPSGPQLVVYSPKNARWEPVAAPVVSSYWARITTRQR
jgi:hypothetical protein